MALNTLRGMWRHCRYPNQLIKHERSYFKRNSAGMDSVPAQCNSMLTCRQLGITSLYGNSLCGPHIYRDSTYRLFQKNNVSTTCMHLKSINVKSVLSEVMSEIDLEALQQEARRERQLEQNSNILFSAKVKEALNSKYDAIVASLGPEDEKKLKVIQLEHSFLYSEGHSIPSTEEMLSQHWLEAMTLQSKNQRLKYYIFLSKRSRAKKAGKDKLAKKSVEPEDIVKKEGYEHGRIFMRIYETTMKRWQNYGLISAMMFGIPLVIDMDYITHMRQQEIKNTASQLQDLYVLNRNEPSPFHLHFTSCGSDNPTFRFLQLFQQDEHDVIATVSEKSYLDLFDKENLVYLSPNARQTMKEFDPTAVYIIGAFNDKATMKPISYARAKEQNIRCQRLPLDEHLDWSLGSKSLTLDQVMKILIAIKNKKTWQEAFTAIPRRKLRGNDGSFR